MPKTSTPDQRIVRHITDALKRLGGEMIEPRGFEEKGPAALGEIDLVLKKTVFGVPITVAIEVRGRGRRATLQWLDELVGKYADVPVDRVIAISTTGFSKAALDKAGSKGIEALISIDAAKIDWPAKFAKFGATRLMQSFRPRSIHLTTEPPLAQPVNLGWRIGTETEAMGTLEETVRSLYRASRGAMSRRFEEMDPSLTLADLQTKVAFFEIPVRPPKGTYLYSPEGTRVRFLEMIIRVTSHLQTDTWTVPDTPGDLLITQWQPEPVDQPSDW